MGPTWPYPFTPNATEEYLHWDYDLGDWVSDEVQVQWLKPFIIIGAAREILLSGVSSSNHFFSQTGFLRRGLVLGIPEICLAAKWRAGPIVRGCILLPFSQGAWNVESILHHQAGDPEAPLLALTLFVTAQTGDEELPPYS